MGKFLLPYICLLFPCWLFAQQSSGEKTEPFSFCSPGVKGMTPGKGIEFFHEISPRNSIFLPGITPEFEGQDYRLLQNRTVGMKLNIPVILGEKFNFLLSAKYAVHHYDFANTDNIENPFAASLSASPLKSMRFGAVAVQSLNDKQYIAFRATHSYNANHFGSLSLHPNTSTISLTAIYGIKKDQNTEIGFGISNSLRFGRFIAYPVILYNKTFNEKWGFEGLLPAKAALRYNAAPGSVIKFDTYLEGGAYNVQLDGRTISEEGDYYQLRTGFINAGITYEHEITNMLWLEATAGYRHGMGFRYFESNTSDPLRGSLGGNLFTRVTLSVRAPSKH